MNTVKLYRHPLSGHAHRVELFLSLLGLPYDLVDVDLANGEHKGPEFLAKNIFGQVPVLQDGDKIINDSNGILVYLAKMYDDAATWYPNDPQVQAEIQRFLSIAAGPVAFGPAAARLVNVFGAGLDHENAKNIANNLLGTLDRLLEGKKWLVGDNATLADVANFSYIASAPEGDVSLEAYPNIQRWLGNVRELTGFTPMQETKVGLNQ